MKSAMSVIKAEVKRKQIKKEKERIVNAFASFPQSTHRAVTKVVR
jgi:hypothetical protein